ncbi:hypothetical protein B0H19DRAFT_1253701 [Mycena capillaripes]|nr:hypothetical protein B0H19DRAFT_1253701 [Mycena capillaripes]
MSSSAAATNSTLFTKRRRAFVACANCRKRKIKCISLSDGDGMPCKRCTAKGLECEYLAVDELAPPPTAVACSNCRRSKIKCATVTDGNCRPCTQCKQKGLECEYSPPNDYSSSQYIMQPNGLTREYFADDSDYGGWSPAPITPPSAGINEYLMNPPPSRGGSPLHSRGGPSYRPPHPYPPSMPSASSSRLSQPSSHHSLQAPPGHSAPQWNHPDAAAFQYYPGSTDQFPVQDPANFGPNQGQYLPPGQRQGTYPSTWPNTIQNLYQGPYGDPNFPGQ